MESQPQNPEFRNNPENFYPCIISQFFYNKMCGFVCLFVCLFVLLLYAPSQQLWSLQDGQFT